MWGGEGVGNLPHKSGIGVLSKSGGSFPESGGEQEGIVWSTCVRHGEFSDSVAVSDNPSISSILDVLCNLPLQRILTSVTRDLVELDSSIEAIPESRKVPGPNSCLLGPIGLTGFLFFVYLSRFEDDRLVELPAPVLSLIVPPWSSRELCVVGFLTIDTWDSSLGFRWFGRITLGTLTVLMASAKFSRCHLFPISEASKMDLQKIHYTLFLSAIWFIMKNENMKCSGRPESFDICFVFTGQNILYISLSCSFFVRSRLN